jgi:hypothetical protein
MTRLKDGPGEENNPIVQYQKWTEHQYDPGYWLGGNVPPSTKNLWSGTSRRLLGAAYVATCVGGAAYAFHYARNSDDLILVLLMLSVYFVPGLIMLFARDQKKRRQQRASQAQTDGPAAGQHKHSHGHGRFSDRHHRRDTEPAE